MAIVTMFVYQVLKATNDPLLIIDAFTTVSSFIATYYMVTKKTDTWVIWFVNDIFYVITYWLLPEQALYLLGLNLIWTEMAVGPYISWKKIMKYCEKINEIMSTKGYRLAKYYRFKVREDDVWI